VIGSSLFFGVLLSSLSSSSFCGGFCLSAVFSDRFSEGAVKNLRDEFPPDEESYTDSYEYLSDSDLDEVEGHTEADELPSEDTAIDHLARGMGAAVPDQGSAQVRSALSSTTDGGADQVTPTAGNSGGRPGTTHIQPGKVAIIRDIAATT